MLLLTPEITRFEDLTFDDVASIAIDSGASRLIADHSDLGPHLAFADVPEKRTTIRIERTLRSADATDAPALRIGQLGTLIFSPHAETGDAGRSRIAIHCMLTDVKTNPANSPKHPHRQTLTFLAVSPDGGAADPITITPSETVD